MKLGWKSSVVAKRLLAADAAKFAKLCALTHDEHYLDVARILLHNTKNMLALPGRTYDLAAPGWQHEHWRLGASPREGRGFGTPEKWMPWVSTNHLYGITALEEFDPELFKQLCAKPATLRKATANRSAGSR